MNVFNHIAQWTAGMGRVFRNEFKLITGDFGVLLFFVALPLLYPVIYTLIYNPEVVRKLPVAVVDNSRTADSRTLVQKAGASPSIEIYAYCADMAEAKRLMAEHKVYGVMEIPADYARNLGNGIPAHVSFYSDMSLLLRYRTFVAALTDLQLDLVNEITGERIAATGLESLAGGGSGMPIASESNFLGDTEQGFASFIIPGIVILILQQSMLLGIGMLGGTSREVRRRNGGVDPREVPGVGVMATVWGKALAIVVFYIPLTIYVMRFIPEMFNLPHYGRAVDYLLFIFPMLLSTAFLGQALVYFMKERESGFILIVFTSVIFLFLSGLTWPRYAMSPLWYWAGNCIPAVWGVEGFIRINSNAATLAESGTAFGALWILTAVYMLAACWVTKYLRVSH
ncbi:MAG: ABC transporter permease [Muribaculaceae bacterium]|nr:ABC transporter permease [Muribaculaceae bacterium]